MKARDVMTTGVVSVHPDAPAREIARLLLEKGISAVPVVNEKNVVVGIVSEGDLVGRNEIDREARRDWWLALLSEGEELNPEFRASLCTPDFLASLRGPERTARELMSTAVVTVDENTEISEVARLLTTQRIKRVPVVRDGSMVGIVSRADLVRALIAQPGLATPAAVGSPRSAAASVDEHAPHRNHPEDTVASAQHAEKSESKEMLQEFRKLVADFEDAKVRHRDDVRRAAAEERQRKVRELIERHISDEGWRGLLHQARRGAEQGQKESLLLSFPSQLCSDGGRAINVSDDSWPATLRGEAADIYRLWERDLKPGGFHLTARMLDFPGGMPGDVGLFLTWTH